MVSTFVLFIAAEAVLISCFPHSRKWVFYISAIVTAVVTILLLGIRESRPSLLLVREVEKLRKATCNNDLKALNPDHTPGIRTFMKIALFHPLQLFFTEPIVSMVSTMSAVAFALIYLFTEALPPTYESRNSRARRLACHFLPPT